VIWLSLGLQLEKSVRTWEVVNPVFDEFGELTNIQVRRWQLISAFDVITEIIILVLIIGLVFNLQMPFKKKFMVVLGFAFRLPYV
jgi:hypothetical protein